MCLMSRPTGGSSRWLGLAFETMLRLRFALPMRDSGQPRAAVANVSFRGPPTFARQNAPTADSLQQA